MTPNRLRRLRRTQSLRAIFKETRLSADELIYPIFIREGIDQKEPIDSMPGQYRHSLESLKKLIEEVQKANVRSVLLFGLPRLKDNEATSAYDACGIVQEAIKQIKA